MKDGKMEKLNSLKRPCQAKTADGDGCQAAALPGSDFCFFHDPDLADQRQAARSFGGSQNKMKTLAAAAPDIRVDSCQDVVQLLSDTINQVRKGQLDPRVANAIGYLANVLIRAAEKGDLEKRIEDLEAAVQKNRQPADFTMTGMEL